MLLDHGATHEPHADGSTPLLKAVDVGSIEISRMLLDRGATHDARRIGTYPLLLAVMKRNYSLCELLVEGGALRPPHRHDLKPLSIAEKKGEHEICRLLLDHETEEGLSALLLLAAEKGEAGICRLLLERGVRQTPDAQGRTPLEIAFEEYRGEAMVTLLRHGANANAAVRTTILKGILGPDWCLSSDQLKELTGLLYRNDADLDKAIVRSDPDPFTGRMVLDVDPDLCFNTLRTNFVSCHKISDVEDVITCVCFSLPTLPRRSVLEVVWEVGVGNLICYEIKDGNIAASTIASLELVSFFSVRPADFLVNHMLCQIGRDGQHDFPEVELEVADVIRRTCLLRDMVNGTAKMSGPARLLPRYAWVNICMFLNNAPRAWFGSRFWDRSVDLLVRVPE